ncbi:MAG: GTP-binding protein [Cytophagales bacterium]|nr:GTP-binding protein [Cytophagales bacterium]
MGKSKKVILLGNFGVGKTSLVRQYVFHQFSEEYMTTIGVRIDKKVVTINRDEVSMIIWDIAGESTHQKIPDSYKLGAHGIIYVIDVLRPSTYKSIEDEMISLQELLPNAPIVKVANKIDLLTEKERVEIVNNLPLNDYVLCSAKNGENVEKAFYKLAGKLI